MASSKGNEKNIVIKSKIMINFLDIKYVTVKDSEKGLDHVLINYMKLRVGEDSGKVSTHISDWIKMPSQASRLLMK